MLNKTPYANVYNRGLWEEVLYTFNNIEKYQMSIWQPQAIDGYPGVRAIFADKTWISNIISENAFLSLNGQYSLMIASQTGTGKTTFLFKRCLPLAINSGKRILYLCSRSTLAAQIKEIAIKDELNGELWDGGKQVKDIKKHYSDLGFSSLTRFGAIEILTFQKLMKTYGDINPREYMAVVIDECHFFTSDSTFNSSSEIILQKIFEIFKNNRKVFISATPRECLDVIWDYHREYLTIPYSQPRMDIFCMKLDYSYIIPHFFTDSKDIISVINARSNEN